MTAPRVDLAQLLVKAKAFAEQWGNQAGCSAHVLDELAATVNAYCASHTGSAHGRADVVIIDDPIKPWSDAHIAIMNRGRAARGMPALTREQIETAKSLPPPGVTVREATAAEQRAALDDGVEVYFAAAMNAGGLLRPPHVELLVHQVLHRRGLHGVLILRNHSTIELEVVKRDGTSIGFPPTAIGELEPGDTVRTPPGSDWTHSRPVSDSELEFAQRHGQAAHHRGGDYLWAQRLPDGRGVFLMPWRRGGVQLSVGTFGESTFHGTWYYDAERADDGWREALGWDAGQTEPKGGRQ
jgi:hypothetical protein